jgi:hypothetical protein
MSTCMYTFAIWETCGDIPEQYKFVGDNTLYIMFWPHDDMRVYVFIINE